MALCRARTVFNKLLSLDSLTQRLSANNNIASSYRSFSSGVSAPQESSKPSRAWVSYIIAPDGVKEGQVLRNTVKNEMLHVDINAQIGSCMPLSAMRIGTLIHNIEVHPGQGGKLVRSAGTCAKILKEPTSRHCLVRLPSGAEKLLDARCVATIGQVSNPSHGTKKLRKAGQSRWLGRRPVVRGVAMNPVDHPHGGGEGRSKSSGPWGKGSRTPWGKPCKSGYKTGPLKRRK